MLKQNLQLKLGQKLAPQQIQLMKLIQLHTLEFQEELERELEENPALEVVKEETVEDDFSSLDNNNDYEEGFIYSRIGYRSRSVRFCW